MKFISYLVCAFCAQSFLFANPQITPSSDMWDEVYKPGYKKPTEVAIGSDLRKELFNILRKEVKTGTKFSGELKAYRNWALFVGSTIDAKGKSISYPPHDNTDSVALWLRTSKGWVLVDFSFGHSDAFYLLWSEVYGVPRQLLGLK